MLRDVVSFEELTRIRKNISPTDGAIASFVHFIERKLGAQMMYDTSRFPFFRPELHDLFQIAEKMRCADVITSFSPRYSPADEPQFREWRAIYRTSDHAGASGTTVDDDRGALTAALAEALERNLWYSADDVFTAERIGHEEEIRMLGDVLAPSAFAGFSEAQRVSDSQLALRDVPYLWTRAVRIPDETPIYVPAQVVSGNDRVQHRQRKNIEPYIVNQITTGLATWPTREGARLRGLLECIERDAYMITWLNHLTPTRFDTDMLSSESSSLAQVVEKCRRYRLEPHILRIVTDAPTFVVMVLLEDPSGIAPRFAAGLKANASATRAAEGAIFEALRGRSIARHSLSQGKTASNKREDIGHTDRLLYWSAEGRAEHLEYLREGALDAQSGEWNNESDPAHFARLLSWTRERGYTVASVPFTQSKKNVTPWHVELTIVPELQPIFFNERRPHIGGARLSEIPRRLGLTPRTPYPDHPHPFV